MKLFKVENDKGKIEEHNRQCENMKLSNPDIDWDKEKIETVFDVFINYSDWLKIIEDSSLNHVKDNIENTLGSYVTSLNWDYQFNSLTDKKVSSYSSNDIYGVCDNASQAIEYCNALTDEDGSYILALTPIIKSEIFSQGGWRWHKWGKYIGVQNPTHEYLYDEKDIDIVYVFNLRKVITENE